MILRKVTVAIGNAMHAKTDLKNVNSVLDFANKTVSQFKNNLMVHVGRAVFKGAVKLIPYDLCTK